MAVNCPSAVKISIIDGALIEAPESNLEEFTYQVGEVLTSTTIMKVKMLYLPHWAGTFNSLVRRKVCLFTT